MVATQAIIELASRLVACARVDGVADLDGVRLDLRAASDRMVISCSGITPGRVVYAMENTVARSAILKLFVCDRTNRWYYGGIAGLTETFDDTVALIGCVVRAVNPAVACSIGTSAGGYMALALAARLGLDRALAFSPQTNIEPAWRAAHQDTRWAGALSSVHALLGPAEPYDIKALIDDASRAETQFHLICPADDPLDLLHGRRLQDSNAVSLLALGESTHNVAADLRRRGTLIDAIEHFVQAGAEQQADGLRRLLSESTNRAAEPSGHSPGTHFLIDWHGQVLVHDGTRWVQMRLRDLRPGDIGGIFQPYLAVAPMDGADGSAADPPYRFAANGRDFASRPASLAGVIYLQTQTGFLVSLIARGGVEWDRAQPFHWELFLPISFSDLADLVHLAQHDWSISRSGRRIDGASVDIETGFRLRVGRLRLDLTRGLPLQCQRWQGEARGFASVILPLSASELVTLVLAGQGLPARLVAVVPRSAAEIPTLGDADEFLQGTGGRMVIAADRPSRFARPVFLQEASADCFITNYVHGVRPPQAHAERIHLRRECDRFVALSRTIEGSVFDETGVSHGLGYINVAQQLPAPFVRGAGGPRLSVSQLNAAPRQWGKYLMFCNGNMHNYYHFLVEGMLVLFILDQNLPTEYGILLPSTAAGLAGRIPLEAISLVNTQSRPVVVGAHDTCLVSDLAWIEDYGIENIPAACIEQFGRLFLSITGASAGERRLYVRRVHARTPAAPAAMAAILDEYGFETVVLETLPFLEQVRLFQQAGVVLAPHGAGLSNLLFCRPGCKVIELMPSGEFRPFFWLIAGKLGLPYSYLSCPTLDGSFNGNLSVDSASLRALLEST